MPPHTRSSFRINKRAKENNSILFEDICRIDQMCCLCHDNIYSTKVYHTPCGHIFHSDCFENQIKTGKPWSTKCSLCRNDLKDLIIEDIKLFNLLPFSIDSYQLLPDYEIGEQEEYWNFAQNIITWYNDYEINTIDEYSSISSNDSIPDLIDDNINLLINEEIVGGNEELDIYEDLSDDNVLVEEKKDEIRDENIILNIPNLDDPDDSLDH